MFLDMIKCTRQLPKWCVVWLVCSLKSYPSTLSFLLALTDVLFVTQVMILTFPLPPTNRAQKLCVVKFLTKNLNYIRHLKRRKLQFFKVNWKGSNHVNKAEIPALPIQPKITKMKGGVLKDKTHIKRFSKQNMQKSSPSLKQHMYRLMNRQNDRPSHPSLFVHKFI